MSITQIEYQTTKNTDEDARKRQLEYSKKHHAKLDQIIFRTPKGKKNEYKELAKAAGKSLNVFIIDCIEEKVHPSVLHKKFIIQQEELRIFSDYRRVLRTIIDIKRFGYPVIPLSELLKDFETPHFVAEFDDVQLEMIRDMKDEIRSFAECLGYY